MDFVTFERFRGLFFKLSLHILLSKFPVKYVLLLKGQEFT